MNQMIITYFVTAFSGLYGIGSVLYFIKNKRFIGRTVLTTIASFIVCALGIYAIINGVSITELQYLIENR